MSVQRLLSHVFLLAGAVSHQLKVNSFTKVTTDDDPLARLELLMNKTVNTAFVLNPLLIWLEECAKGDFLWGLGLKKLLS